ncbi:MAG: hypothetical protein ACYCVD_18180 [Desulfitobacteriaceae bacterium]
MDYVVLAGSKPVLTKDADAADLLGGAVTVNGIIQRGDLTSYEVSG